MDLIEIPSILGIRAVQDHPPIEDTPFPNIGDNTQNRAETAAARVLQGPVVEAGENERELVLRKSDLLTEAEKNQFRSRQPGCCFFCYTNDHRTFYTQFILQQNLILPPLVKVTDCDKMNLAISQTLQSPIIRASMAAIIGIALGVLRVRFM